MTNKLFVDEKHLKRHIALLERKRKADEVYAELNRDELLDIHDQLCFIFDNYDKLY